MGFNPFSTIMGGGGFGGIGSTIQAIIWVVLVGVPVMGAIIGFFYWIYKRRKWNLDVEFKLPRSDGKIVSSEWGKGSYNVKRGIVFLKRKKKAKIPMKPFNVGKYLQGEKILTVVQVGPMHYEPVLNESWMEMEEDQPTTDSNGKVLLDEEGNPIHERAALLNMRIDTTEDKAWSTYCEREGKSTYSIVSLLSQYAVPISIGLVIVLWGIQFIILYQRIK